jgi:hypothetical protein
MVLNNVNKEILRLEASVNEFQLKINELTLKVENITLDSDNCHSKFKQFAKSIDYILQIIKIESILIIIVIIITKGNDFCS